MINSSVYFQIIVQTKRNEKKSFFFLHIRMSDSISLGVYAKRISAKTNMEKGNNKTQNENEKKIKIIIIDRLYVPPQKTNITNILLFACY